MKINSAPYFHSLLTLNVMYDFYVTAFAQRGIQNMYEDEKYFPLSLKETSLITYLRKLKNATAQIQELSDRC